MIERSKVVQNIRRNLFIFAVLVLILAAPTVTAAAESLAAFPGAEGFGAYAEGGRGGQVFIVTNLNDSGPGSLREAVEAVGPRIVVFEVSGTIFLNSPLTIRNPYITIAGQTSPGGITLANLDLSVRSDHTIIRHIRVRPGDTAGVELDTLEIRGANNVILDHVSTSWGTDETLSVVDSDLVTVQWCIISESLNKSVHAKGAHGYGSLLRGGYGNRVTFHHNIWAHHRGRMPRPGNYNNYKIDPKGQFVDFRNNVFYNWKDYCGNNHDSDSITKYNFINNYYQAGPSTIANKRSNAFDDRSSQSAAYFAGNYMNGHQPQDPWSIVSGSALSNPNYKQTQPFACYPVYTEDAASAYERVVNSAGALPRDPVDHRVMESVQEGTGQIIDSQTEVGGWPLLTGEAAADRNRNGIPDWWEIKHGLNSDDPDLSRQVTDSGYTVIEEYLNWLAHQLTAEVLD